MSVADSDAAPQRPPRVRIAARRDLGAVADLRGLHAVPRAAGETLQVRLDAFGELVPISRQGGQGRVYRPAHAALGLGGVPVVVKLYRRAASPAAAQVLAAMVAWGGSLEPGQRERLHRLAAWPLSVVNSRGLPAGIVMQDVSRRFSAPFVMPSGRRENVLLALEHLLGADVYLQLRGLDIRLDTVARARVAERVSDALAFLHRHAIVASDIAPSNVLVSLGAGAGAGAAAVCLIDCDSMVFRGRQALPSVETGDWDIPADFGEPPRTRAADAYKLGLVVLRLFARSHDARSLAPHLRHVPHELRDLLYRALERDAANRPPAGEWQRTLSQLIASGQLNGRYPGPMPRPLAPRQPIGAPRQRALEQPPAAPTAPRAAAAPVPPRAPAAGLRVAVMLLWLVALAVVVGLMLSRLLAATVPTQGPGAGAGVGAGGPEQAPFVYHFYFAPGGGGQGRPDQGQPPPYQ